MLYAFFIYSNDMKQGIYKGDSMQLINDLPNNYLDACFTDPPYGIDYQSARRTDKTEWKEKIKNDDKPFTDWLKPLFTKMKNGSRLICFYRWDVQNEFKEAIENAGFEIKSQIVWDKVIHGMGDLKGEFAPQHELIFYATKGRYEFKTTRPKTVYRCKRIQGEKLIHPNEKPIQLMQQIIRDLTIQNEMILDPFGGSFSTYKASRLEKRQCISFELSETYFNIGKKEVEKPYSMPLF